MPRRVAVAAFTAACAVALASLHLVAADTFDVGFATAKPLGLQLDDRLVVVGFRRDRGSRTPSVAEATGWLHAGDRLVAVNERPVQGMSLPSVVRMIAKASLPKVLSFEARNGESRKADMQAFLEGEGNLDGATGVVEVASDGVPVATLPFVQAMFGTNTTCSRARLVRAQPADGCSAFTNADAVANAIVLVERGGCAFVAKASNVQAADGYAMVVVNDDATAVRMPQGNLDDRPPRINIPCVMVGADDGEVFGRVERGHHHTPVVGRLRHDGVSCDAFSPRAAKAAEDAAAAAAAEQQRQQAAAEGEDARLAVSLDAMLDYRAWPKDAKLRKRLYFRLSRLHHPDKDGGSQQRFEVLSQAYEQANDMYEREQSGAM